MIDLPQMVRVLAEKTRAAGGRALLVGGTVRDQLLQQTPTDIDIEIYGLKPKKVEAIANEIGKVREVGRAFGVLTVITDYSVIDLSLPRRESKIAPGHRGFAIDADPNLSPQEAASRRDFTINAIAKDPLTGEIIDPFGGREDLKNRVLRVVNKDKFVEDPLRVMRGAVFVAQFNLSVDSKTEEIIKNTANSLSELPGERMGEEWRKLLLRPKQPSLGLKKLKEWGVLDKIYPDFSCLAQTPQEPRWHPEGDVWTHTMMAVDEAAKLVRGEGLGKKSPALSEDNKYILMLAALCHDLGKAATTRKEQGVIKSRGHEKVSEELTKKFLKMITASSHVANIVTRLVREHLMSLRYYNKALRGAEVSNGDIRKLARRLEPASIMQLAVIATADHKGRGPFPEGSAPAAKAGERLFERAEKLGVAFGPPVSVLSGKDLIELGFEPGQAFGEIINGADALSDEQGLSREELLNTLKGCRSGEEALKRLEALGH